MRYFLRAARVVLCLPLLAIFSLASAYNARPRLIVILVIDQFRGDYLERYRDQFGEGGFRLFLDHGSNFTDCDYAYANTRTAPGHATLLTGAYTSGHGILANEWWDPQKKRVVTSVQDDDRKLVGIASTAPGASPHNLMADTLGDEIKLATAGKAHVFGVALKDRASVLPAGFSADAAYWIDQKSGLWITSTYYRDQLPKWVQDFNDSGRAKKYLNRDWTGADGQTIRSTTPPPGSESSFYQLAGSTPFANDYEFEFARELITYEHVGNHEATDLLIISLSANDILGHQVGPDSPEMRAMALATDRQLSDFFTFLAHQIGLANVWIALSADHGIAPLPSAASALRVPAANLSSEKWRLQLNQSLTTRFSPSRPAEYIKSFDYPIAWLNDEAFAASKIRQEDAERATGEMMKQMGMRGYFTRSQLARGDRGSTEFEARYANSYSPLGGWYVMGVPAPFTVGVEQGTDHASPYSYDTHVPLLLYGLPFQAGTYRTHAEPVDLAVTLASLLGINRPTHATGRVLTEALASRHIERPSSPAGVKSPLPHDELKPVRATVVGSVQQ